MADGETEAAASALLDLCKAKKLMVATAKSCTGGLVAGALTEIAGSSAVVDRGFVTYTNEAKHQMLGVPNDDAREVTARSAARPPRRWREARWAIADADLAVSITGIAGPGGGTAEKPVGLVHFAAAARGGRSDSSRAALRRHRARPRCGGDRCCEALSMLTELARRPKPSCAPVDLIGARLEGRGEAAERGIEHRAHQHAERAAPKLVVDEELDLAGVVAGRLEGPAVLHAAERALADTRPGSAGWAGRA